MVQKGDNLTSSARWNEWNLSEEPTIIQLQELGYEFIEPSIIDVERESRQVVILQKRLESSIQKLNS